MEPTAFVLTPVDAVDLVHRALRRLDKHPDTDVSDAIDSILSQTVFQLRSRVIVFTAEQRQAYDTLRAFVGD